MIRNINSLRFKRSLVFQLVCDKNYIIHKKISSSRTVFVTNRCDHIVVDIFKVGGICKYDPDISSCYVMEASDT